MAESYFVSFSGGADSTALLLWAVQHLKNVCAVHFEHGLRGAESLRDAGFCRRFCAARNIPLTVIPLDVPHRKLAREGDEAAARRLRLEAWKTFLADKANPIVLLGHHADDVVETVLQRFFRGSNVSGLTALRPDRIVNGIHFRRPLLHWTRMKIESFLHENGITEWCTDCTNARSDFLRNYLRIVVLPSLYETFPYTQTGIVQSANVLADDADFIESVAAEHYEQCRDGAIQEWRKLHPALLARVFRNFVSEVVGADFLPNHNDISRLSAALKKPGCKTKISLSGGKYYLLLENGRIRVSADDKKGKTPQPCLWNWRKDTAIQYGDFLLSAEILPAPIPFEKNHFHAYFDADSMPESLEITPRRDGDAILAFDGHRKSLKKLFIDAHIPTETRSKIPVLRLADGQIVFVPGIQTSPFACVTDTTKNILHIEVKKSQSMTTESKE